MLSSKNLEKMQRAAKLRYGALKPAPAQKRKYIKKSSPQLHSPELTGNPAPTINWELVKKWANR